MGILASFAAKTDWHDIIETYLRVVLSYYISTHSEKNPFENTEGAFKDGQSREKIRWKLF